MERYYCNGKKGFCDEGGFRVCDGCKYFNGEGGKIIEVEDDNVSVTRCKDCKFCVLAEDGKYDPENIICEHFLIDGMKSCDYCSYGIRREE